MLFSREVKPLVSLFNHTLSRTIARLHSAATIRFNFLFFLLAFFSPFVDAFEQR